MKDIVDVLQSIGILALAGAVICQVKINQRLMREIDGTGADS